MRDICPHCGGEMIPDYDLVQGHFLECEGCGYTEGVGLRFNNGTDIAKAKEVGNGGDTGVH